MKTDILVSAPIGLKVGADTDFRVNLKSEMQEKKTFANPSEGMRIDESLGVGVSHISLLAATFGDSANFELYSFERTK